MNASTMLAKPMDESTQTARAVRQIINSFLIVFKNYALYPENHAICKTSLEKVKPPLHLFFQNNFHFRIDVQKNALAFDSEIVYEGGETEENLAFILFRDGIEWLEFQRGLTEDEIDRFFKVLYRYRILREESEGDLVTALWAEDFSHVRYGVKEVFWNADNLIDLGELRAADPEQVEKKAFKAGLAQMRPPESISEWAESFRLTPEDHEAIKQMIIEDETLDRTQDVLDILGIILMNLENSKDFEEILNYLKEEFFDALQLGELDFTLKLLKNLHSTRQKLNQPKPWTVPLFRNFFSDLCRESTLSALKHVWPAIGSENVEKQKLVFDILTLLPSRAIPALISMMLESHPFHIHDLMMDIVVQLARRNSNPLKKLLTNSNEATVALSLKVLSMLNQPENNAIFLDMTRHDSENIRKQALAHLLTREGNFLDVCISLVDDPSDAVRWLALKHLGHTRNFHAEKLLTTYLENKDAREENRSHILDCYRTLGQCGDNECLGFLKKTLFPRSWIQKLGIGSTIHQEGALRALTALNPKKSGPILSKASRSLVPSVRSAYKKVLAGGK